MSNRGHGHVYPNEDGAKARCGGPAICFECAGDIQTLLDERKRLMNVVEFAKQKFHYIKDEYCERRHSDVIRDVLARFGK